MARKLVHFEEALIKEIEAAWNKRQATWVRKRLMVVRLIGQGELTVTQIMKAVDVSRQTIFTYRTKVVEGGVASLLDRKWAGARKSVVVGDSALEMTAMLESGKFLNIEEVQAWVFEQTQRRMSLSGVRAMLRRIGCSRKFVRKRRTKKKVLSEIAL